MSVKTGDKVRFLNATGGGTVTRIIDKNLVGVEDKDGFEIPVLMRECVVIESSESKNKPAGKPTPAPTLSKDTTPAPATGEKVEVVETPSGEKLNVALAFLPDELKSLQNTSFDCYLVNDSNYFLFVNYMNKIDKQWKSRYTGEIEPNMKIFVDEIVKEQLNDLEQVCIQFIAYKQEKPFDLKNPVSADIRIEVVKFYKLHSFKENDYFDEDALIFPLVRNDVPEKSLHVDAEEIEKAIREKQLSERPQRMPIYQKKEPAPVIEVDLHASELLDSLSGLGNAEILNYQMEKFREVLQENQFKKGQKIIFIHGKGEGILRKNIIDELKSKYKNYHYQDASFREYGYGATMVTIK
ncbi:MAG: DUF2027 domain-containing protein [Candidatus Azobacteroides sp.]|nr:DUF2027 domain-containing protein [Candidatus Azobacteroides sp.]